MTTPTQTLPKTRAVPWAGYTLTALSAAFLLLDGGMKVLSLAPAVEASVALGYSAAVVPFIGATLLACLVIYLIPATAVFGAVLLTGYLGGAVATHVQQGSPLFSVVFPVLIGALLWGGLLLRSPHLRAVFPFQRG
jgi:hypothetical protein